MGTTHSKHANECDIHHSRGCCWIYIIPHSLQHERRMCIHINFTYSFHILRRFECRMCASVRMEFSDRILIQETVASLPYIFNRNHGYLLFCILCVIRIRGLIPIRPELKISQKQFHRSDTTIENWTNQIIINSWTNCKKNFSNEKPCVAETEWNTNIIAFIFHTKRSRQTRNKTKRNKASIHNV